MHAQKNHNSTSHLKSDRKYKLSVPGFLQNVNFCQMGYVMDYFWPQFYMHVQKQPHCYFWFKIWPQILRDIFSYET